MSKTPINLVCLSNEQEYHLTQDDTSAAVPPWEPWSDRFAEWYVIKYGDHPTSALAVSTAALDGSEIILDIGCGSGAAVRAAAAALSTGNVTGVDPSPAMVRIAKQQASSHPAEVKLSFIDGKAEALPIGDACIDIALAVCSLSHWYDVTKGLSEVGRVLRNDGRFIIVEEIFGDPEMALDIQAIRNSIREAGFIVSDVTEQDCADTRVLMMTAHLENSR